MSECVLPIFSSEFYRTCLILRCLVHFEFIFVYNVRECFNFLLIHVAVDFSQHHLLKGLSFLLYIVLPLYPRLIDHRYIGFSRDFLLVPLIIQYIYVFVLALCFDYWSLQSSLQSGYLILSAFAFLSQNCFVYLGSFVSIHTVNFFVLVVWKMPLVIW